MKKFELTDKEIEQFELVQEKKEQAEYAIIEAEKEKNKLMRNIIIRLLKTDKWWPGCVFLYEGNDFIELL